MTEQTKIVSPAINSTDLLDFLDIRRGKLVALLPQTAHDEMWEAAVKGRIDELEFIRGVIERWHGQAE